MLACGAELKNTFCLAKGERAWVGHHIGDLENYETLRSFEEGIEHFKRLFAVEPRVVAHDLHPEYLSTKYALELEGVELEGVQHHHAHLAACLAEHGESGPALGAIYDGTGYGTDGSVWGGELLHGDLRRFQRVGHLFPVRLPGGEAAIRQPWRMACAWLCEALGRPPDLPETLVGEVGQDAWHQVALLARGGLASPLTTSMGRLFDAVAALAGVRGEVTYEGQAAIELEAACDPGERGSYPLPLTDGALLDARPTILAVAEEAAEGWAAGTIAARFHNAVAHATASACELLAERLRTPTVVLSGGVFQNRRLLETTAALLSRGGAAGAHARAAAAERRRGGIRAGRRGGGEDGRLMAGLDQTLAQLGHGQAVLVVLAVALLLGLRHATDPDHLAAVSTLIATDPRDGSRRAGRLGLAWGLGHATTLFAFGLPIVLYGAYLPDAVQRGAELIVGIVIAGLALRLLAGWRQGRFHAHLHSHGEVEHRHLHPHEHGAHHAHRHEPERSWAARRARRMRSGSSTAWAAPPAWACCSWPASRSAPRRPGRSWSSPPPPRCRWPRCRRGSATR